MNPRPYPWRVLLLSVRLLALSLFFWGCVLLAIYGALSAGWYIVTKLREVMP